MPGFRGRLEDALGAVCEFIAHDTCHLCGQASPGDPDGGGVPGSRASLLAAPVPHRLLGLTVLSHPLCWRCTGKFAAAGGVVDLGEGLPLLASFLTGESLLRIIHTIKFQRYRGLLAGASAAIAATLADEPGFSGHSPLLVAVPMDVRALRRRGFNQSADLAGRVALAMGLDVLENALEKCRSTRPQSLMSRSDRTGNVRNVFAVRGTAVRERNVLIVDDIVTTGATVRACSQVLLAAGAASTAVISLGRSPRAGIEAPR